MKTSERFQVGMIRVSSCRMTNSLVVQGGSEIWKVVTGGTSSIRLNNVWRDVIKEVNEII